MRFRKIRKIGRWHNSRLVGIVAVCFILGLIVGLRRKDPRGEKQPIAERLPDPRVAEWMKSGRNLELLGRKKLSVKADNIRPTFTRLPASFERNFYPPRAPATGYFLEPNTVIERIKNPDTGNGQYFMLFIVKTSPIHFTRRDVIRRTWGAVKKVDDEMFNTIFVVGNVEADAELQAKIVQESVEYGDILQASVPEGYRNLPFKVLSAMQWLVAESDRISSKFYTFTDDDCVINIANVVDFFRLLNFVDVDDTSDNVEVNNEPIRTPRAPPSVKKIQDIDLHRKMKVNEVTLPAIKLGKMQRNAKLKIDDSEGKSARQERKAGSETTDESIQMDPNAKIQIERTGPEDDISMYQERNNDRMSPMTANDFTTANNAKQTFNPFYKHNAKNLTDYLKASLNGIKEPGSAFKTRRLYPDGIYCGFSYDPHQIPQRNLKIKWGVSMEQYSEECYPAFCHGGMYTMSGSLMTSIFAISTVTDYSAFHLEDVLVTGILREKTGVPDSRFIRGNSSPKTKPLMYYAWDSGPRVIYKMSRKWRYFTKTLLSKRFVMEATRNGKLATWSNYEN